MIRAMKRLFSFWYRWTIRTKFFGIITCLLGAVSLFIFIYFPSRLETQAVTAIVAKAVSIGEMTAFSVSPALFFEDSDVLEESLEGAKQNEDLLYLMVLNESGSVAAAFNRGKTRQVDLLQMRNSNHISEDGTVFRTVTPILKDGRKIGDLLMGISLDELRAEIGRSRRNIAWMSLLIFVIGMVAVLAASTVVTGPLKHMVETVDKVAQGDFTHRAIVSSEDEVGYLAKAFNLMVDNLESAYAQLKEVNQTLEVRVQDRTEALQQETTERRRAEGQLRQSQKMEAIGRLAGGIAHDFNNLLTVIMSDSYLALRELPANHPVCTFLRDIEDATERLAKLTSQLLAFSRKQIVKPRAINLNDLVLKMDSLLRRLIGEDIEMIALTAPTLGQVNMDPGQMEQVLVNLVVNARDAMPEGGKLIIETAHVELDETYTREHPDVEPGQYVMFAVTDTGTGMSNEVKAHLFEPFFTTKETGKGTGLGLATCYGIVSQNNGHIGVYTEPGHGTTFKVYLPYLEDEVTEHLSKKTQSDQAFGGAETILVVEDNEAVRDLAVGILARQGYTAVSATNGEEALDLVQGQRDRPIDLVVTDIVMPKMNGVTLANRLKSTQGNLKVLFMSGYPDRTTVPQGILEKDFNFLAKPFKPNDLAQRVRELLDKEMTPL